MKNKVIFRAPSFESIQHTVTKFDDDHNPKEASLHSDVSLLLRVDKLRMSATEFDRLKASLQELPDYDAFSPELRDALDAATDKELLNSCPSRYVSTLSEKQTALAASYGEYRKADKNRVETEAKAKAAADNKASDDAFNKALEEYNKIMMNINRN